MIKKHWKGLLISIIIALLFGGLGALLANSMSGYQELNKPSFAPPAILFPIVWSILYILMGISSYIVYISDNKEKESALIVYGTQLIINSLWTFIFFNLQARLFAFMWLLILIILVCIMIYKFFKVNKLSAYLQIPYLIWLVFAAVLNFATYTLNK